MSSNQSINITGSGNVLGDHSSSNVNIRTGNSAELEALVAQLRQQISQLSVSDGAKQVMLAGVVPEIEQAVTAPDPKAAVQTGLKRLNENLELAGATGEKVAKIAGIVKQIAGAVGLTLGAAAPFLAKFFG